MNVKNAAMNAIAWMTSTWILTVFVLVSLVSVVILKIKGKSVCHVNKGERQDELQIYSTINCDDGSTGFIRWTGRL